MTEDSYKNKLILVVDDEERMSRFIRLNLEHDGFRVIEASRGMSAIQLIRERMPDLVILDVMMPRKDGPARMPLARNMMINGCRSFCPTIPVMVAKPRMAAISTNEFSFIIL